MRTRRAAAVAAALRWGAHRLSFVKAGAEGAEPAVSQGGLATLRGHRPTLLLEIEDRHLAEYAGDAAEALGHLHRRGYRVHRRQYGRWVPNPRVAGHCRTYLFTA